MRGRKGGREGGREGGTHALTWDSEHAERQAKEVSRAVWLLSPNGELVRIPHQAAAKRWGSSNWNLLRVVNYIHTHHTCGGYAELIITHLVIGPHAGCYMYTVPYQSCSLPLEGEG